MKKMPKCICRGKSASNHEWIYGLPVDGKLVEVTARLPTGKPHQHGSTPPC